MKINSVFLCEPLCNKKYNFTECHREATELHRENSTIKFVFWFPYKSTKSHNILGVVSIDYRSNSNILRIKLHCP